MFLESSFSPFPSEAIVPPAGYLTAAGTMNLWSEINRYKLVCPLSQTIVSAMRPGDQLGVYQMEGANFNYYTGYNQMRWLGKEKELRQFLRSPQRVLCIMRERHNKLLEKDPTLAVYVIATGQVGHRHLVVVSNRQTP